jgi:alkaline phosphatase
LHTRRINRRGFLAATGSLVAAIGLGGRSTAAQATRPTTLPARAAGKARNVIFVVSDGMSTGTLTLADTLCRRRDNRRSHWVELMHRPGVRRALVSTHAADSLVTDSAAGGSAWGCGHKCNNGALNFLPDGSTPDPILLLARNTGRSIGLVTTTRLTHATPASFITNIRGRALEGPVAQQMLERGTDVLLGGGAKHFPTTLLEKHPSVRLVSDRDALLAAASADGRLIGLFDTEHLRFAVERPPHQPTPAEMTRVALERLGRNPDGFVLQIESGGRVDHAAHENDAVTLVHEQLACDDSIAEVLRFAGDRDDTLVVVTTDHGNANPGMTLYGKTADEGLQRIIDGKRSFEWITPQLNALKDDVDAQIDLLPRLIQQAYGIDVNADERDLLARMLRKQRVMPFKAMDDRPRILGAVLANYLGVSFISANHTSDHVECLAFGPGSEALLPTMDNTDLHWLMRDALGIPRG